MALGVMLILVGVRLLSLGLVADVVGRTYHEAQGKRTYKIRERVAGQNTLPAASDEVAAGAPLRELSELTPRGGVDLPIVIRGAPWIGSTALNRSRLPRAWRAPFTPAVRVPYN